MINKLKHTVKKGKDGIIKAIAVVGTTLFITLSINANPASAETKKEIGNLLKDKKYADKEIVVKMDSEQTTEKTAKFEAVQDSIDALDFAVQNVDKYYPDMKDHLTTMINSFRDQEHKDSTTALLNKMAANISNPEQKTGAIIYVLERRVFSKSDFAKKYDSQITDATFDQMDIFRIKYDKRFDTYYANLLTQTEQLKAEIKRKEEQIKQKEEQIKQKDEQIKQQEEEIKQGLKDLEDILSKFTSEDIKTNSYIKELTIKTEDFYKERGFPISEHLQNLFNATK